MIIRSQNKRILLNINGVSSIYICELTYSNTKNTVFMVETEKCALGTYSTEEKAIKVLDMIKDAYCKMMFWNTTTSGCSEKVGNCKEDIALKYIGQCSSNYCFQMPQDSEVSVE